MWLLASVASAGPFDAVDAASTPAGKADALYKLVEGPKAGEAWDRFGQLFADQAQPGLALIAWEKAFAIDDKSGSALRALQLADEHDDVGLLADELAELKAAPGDGDTKGRMAYVMARSLLRMEEISASERWIKRVPGTTPSFADSESLRGVLLALRGKKDDALVPLQTARAAGVQQKRGERFDTKILMNIARTYYADGNYGQAIYHYSQVPRNSDYWPEARFEKAWSHYRGDDIPGAIGELQTHESSFFDDLWFPEAQMLRAQSLFMLCRFNTAVEAMDAYEKRYQPILEQIDAELGTMSPGDAYADAVAAVEGTPTRLPLALLRPYRTEDRLAQTRRAIEMYTRASTASGLGEHDTIYQGWAKNRATELEKAEGERILGRVKAARKDLAEMMSGLEIARIDILDRESDLYGRAAATGGDLPDRKADLKRIYREKKGFRVWPFEGEYWADELGWYEIEALSICEKGKTP